MFLLEAFGLIGAFVFSISASLTAIKRKFDLFGIALIAFITSIGGGSLRDIMLGIHPLTWLKTPYHSYAILLGILFSFLFTRSLYKLKKTFFWFDTVGIAIATIIGIHCGLDCNIYPILTIFFGVISAVFGGIIRDIICNEVPLILRREIYATPCIIGGLIYVLLYKYNVAEAFSLPFTILIIITIRYYSIKLKLRLPNLTDKLENKLESKRAN